LSDEGQQLVRLQDHLILIRHVIVYTSSPEWWRTTTCETAGSRYNYKTRDSLYIFTCQSNSISETHGTK